MNVNRRLTRHFLVY